MCQVQSSSLAQGQKKKCSRSNKFCIGVVVGRGDCYYVAFAVAGVLY
jgi:hypothetical protein